MTEHLALSPEELESIEPIRRDLSTRARYEISLDALLEKWMSFVAAVESGYDDSIYEYLNHLGIRASLEEILQAAPVALQAKLNAVLEMFDERFRAVTVEDPDKLTSHSAWWSRRVPRHPGPELAADLKTE